MRKLRPAFGSHATHLVALLLFVLIIGGLVVGLSRTSHLQVLGAHTVPPHPVKQLRAIAHHSAKAVCDKPRHNQARCMAKISTDSAGQPLTILPNTSGSLGPTEFHTAYQLPCTPGGPVAAVCAAPASFGPATIAIVDAGNFSSGTAGLESSLQSYDQYFGLPACSLANGCLSVINQAGATSPLPADAGWSDEIALDVEVAHMTCQTCHIVLVEGNDAMANNLAIANSRAAALKPLAISNSWGADSDVPSLDKYFSYPSIAEVASTGDSGSVGSGAAWPSDNPNVVAAAGTTLQLFTDNTWAGEAVWSGSGGGCSTYYPAPSWQSARSDWASHGCGSYRAFGDVSADADPNTGAAININGTWYQIGGTSLSAPLIASMFALNGSIPDGVIASSVPYASFTSTNSHDIVSGTDCTSAGQLHCTASPGFDTPSGMGSPNGLSGLTVLLAPPTSLAASSVSQSQISLRWTASSSTGVTGYEVYRNNVSLGSTSGTTFTDSSVTTNKSYSYYVIAHDSNGNVSGPSDGLTVSTYFEADINQDSHINLLDLSLLASKYGQRGDNLGRSDINQDGVVDLLDLSLLASSYGSE